MKKRNGLWWGALALGLAAVNFLASKLHARFDLTQEKRYSLSGQTKRLLRGITDPVQVDVFLGGEYPAGFKKLANGVEEFLQEVKEASGGRLTYRFQDPLKGLNDSATRYAVDSLNYFYAIPAFTLQAPGKAGDELTQKLVIPGAVIHYKDTAAGVNFLKGEKSFGTEPEQLAALYNNVEASIEYKFASALQKLTQKKKVAVGYALGNGEGWGYNVDDAVRSVIKEYRFDTVNLAAASFVPPFDGLLVVKPTKPFSESEKLKLDQYVMHGGKVFWMLDNVYAEFDSLYQSQGFIAFDRGLNLDDLLFNYGVRLNQSFLQDMQADKLPQISTNGSQQRRLVDWPFFPVLNGTNHPISKNLDGVRLMFPTTLDTVEAEGIRKTTLLQTSDNTRVLQAPAKIDFSFLTIAPDAKEFNKKKLAAGVLLEGKFVSAFANRVSGAVQDSMRTAGYAFLPACTAENKMIVVSDGDLAMNQYSQNTGPLPMGTNVFTRYTYANKDFFLNCLDYLVNTENILTIRSKEYSLRLLDPRKTEAEKGKWQAVNVALPVALVALFGVVYQSLRRRRFAS